MAVSDLDRDGGHGVPKSVTCGDASVAAWIGFPGSIPGYAHPIAAHPKGMQASECRRSSQSGCRESGGQ